jgi:UDP-glucose 4-epimerase
MTVLITGGAGYIGSHIAHFLSDSGRECVVLDDLSHGSREAVPAGIRLVVGKIEHKELVHRIIREHKVTAVMHLAGSVAVAESFTDPLACYRNNVCGTVAVLEACISAGIRNVVFSSSAAVYGNASGSAISETTPASPASPYGWSKVMSEAIFEGLGSGANLSYAILRYFNVAGSDPELRTGARNASNAHLIKIASEVAVGRREYLPIYGADYPTKDGSCIRDFIHVWDLAKLHSLSLQYLLDGNASVVLNCGYGQGASVLEVVKAFGRAMKEELPVRFEPRRAGDVPVVIADAGKARDLLRWKPQFDSIDAIVDSALAWELKSAK